MNRSEVLNAARDIVCSDRNIEYGEPEDNFAIIADYWTTYLCLRKKIPLDFILTPEDVANLMILFKMGRITSGGNTDDSFIDIAGYAACACECKED